MPIRDQLRTLMWRHGVENDALLDALDWKMRKIMTDKLTIPAPWLTEIEYLRSAHVKACEALGDAEAEIARCHARLEIDHCFEMVKGGSVRREIPLGERPEFPDAVTCRDATIVLLENQVNDAKAERDRLRADNEFLKDGIEKHVEQGIRLGERAEKAEAERDRLREALEKIAEVEEFRHNSGVYDYRPALDASTMREIASEALTASGGDRV